MSGGKHTWPHWEEGTAQGLQFSEAQTTEFSQLALIFVLSSSFFQVCSVKLSPLFFRATLIPPKMEEVVPGSWQ